VFYSQNSEGKCVEKEKKNGNQCGGEEGDHGVMSMG